MKKVEVRRNDIKPSRVFDLIYDGCRLYISIKIINYKKPILIDLSEYLRGLGLKLQKI